MKEFYEKLADQAYQRKDWVKAVQLYKKANEFENNLTNQELHDNSIHMLKKQVMEVSYE